jgi:hypothetical protein
MTCGQRFGLRLRISAGRSSVARFFTFLPAASVAAFLGSSVDLRAQEVADVPPRATATVPEGDPTAEALQTGADLAALATKQPFGDPALVYVPPAAEGLVTAELAAFGDEPALHPLYRTLLQGILASAPVPPDRLEDLEGFTAFVVPYDATASGETAAPNPIGTPDEYLAQASVDTTRFGFGCVLRFREPIYDRDLRQALGPDAERTGSALIPTYRLDGGTVRLLENRYLVTLQGELSPGVIPYLNPGSFAQTPTGLRIAALKGPTLRARGLIAGDLLRRFGSSGLTLDDQALFQTFWGDRVEAWTFRLDSVTQRNHSAFVAEAMIVTNSETAARTLEEDLVGVVRLALAAARDWTASDAPAAGEDRSVLESSSAGAAAAKLLVNSIAERRLFVGHIGPAAGVRLVMPPEEMEALPRMLSGTLFAAPTGDALEQDRERQRLVLRAMRAYYDAHGRIPPPVVYDKDSGQPRSWRVELLPYLGEKALFAQYRRDEAWDSPHNRELIARIPDVYRSSFDAADPPGLAIAALVHPEGVFSPEGAVRGADIVDGGSRTMALATVRLPIPWTRPQDIDAVGTEALSDLAWTDAGVLAGFADGRVHLLHELSPERLRQLIVRNDGQPTEALEDLPGIELDPESNPAPAAPPESDAEPAATPPAEAAPPLVPAGQLPAAEDPPENADAPPAISPAPNAQP